MSAYKGPTAFTQCEFCTIDFVVLVSEQKRGNGRFCSKSCAVKCRLKGKAPHYRYSPLETRFWAKVSKSDDCWIWIGSRTRNNKGELSYGSFRVGGKRALANTTAHRVSWMLANGPIPDNHDICHTCDNPACVRPDHLFLGSRKRNVEDMHEKGRWPASYLRLPVSLLPRLIELAGGDGQTMRAYAFRLLEAAVATEEQARKHIE